MLNDTQLHCHTHGSNLRMLDCIIKTKDLIDKAIELNMKAVAVTDHASISEAITAIKYSKELQANGKDIKVLIGDEIYVVDDVNEVRENYIPKETKFYHFILIAKDSIGFEQIRKINALGWQSSFFTGKMRRVPNDKKQIQEVIGNEKGHLLASTACIGGEFASYFLKNEINKSIEFFNWCVDTFGKDNFAIEIQPSINPDQIKFNKWAYKFSKKNKVRCISTCDVHYLNKEHHDIHKAFLTSREADRGEGEDFYATTYMMSIEEKREYLDYFTDQEYEEIVNNGWEFVKDVEFFDMEHITIIPERNLSNINFSVKHIFKDWYEKYPYIKKFAYSEYDQDKYFLYMVEEGFLNKKQEFNETNISRIDWELKQLWLISDKLNSRMSAYYNLVDYIVDICWEIGFVGVSRGSVTGFYTAYLIDIHQMNPIQWNLPAYRHLNAERVTYPDVDLDSSARNRPKIIEKLKEVFGEDNILNICTFKTETTKSAFKTVCRGLNIPNEEGDYLSSLIPVERGKQWSVKDCLEGNEEKGRKPITELINRIKELKQQTNIDLTEYVKMIEGLISGISLHASGIYIFNNGYLAQNSLMKTPRGDDITCWNMPDSDYCGGLKYDSLTTECQDKLEVCMELLEKYNKIIPKSTLRETYNTYLHPDILDYTSTEMWDKCSNGEITDLFQFITPVGGKCIQKIKPHSLEEMANANSLMRISVEGDIQPVDKFLAYKNDRSLWYKELEKYGITNKEEVKALEKVLSYCYGCPSMQEDVMELCMEEKIAGFSLAESDVARKIIAKKKSEDVNSLKEKFYNSVKEHGNSINVANYVWEECIKPQLAYSFSRNHVLPYSLEALQEMNLYYHYPSVYWNCACLMVNAGLSEKDEEYVTKTNKTTNYGKIAKAIYRSKNFGINVLPPLIDDSDISFTPNEKNNSIIFGLGGIAGINPQISQQIISNRPYSSFKDFYHKNTFPNSLITPSKIKQLIKAGCFDCFNPNRIKIMKQYITLSTPKPTILTMQNISTIRQSKVYISLDVIAPYNFFKYVTDKSRFYCNHPKFKSKKCYWLNERGEKYFKEHIQSSLTYEVDFWTENDRLIVVDKSIEKVIKPSLEALKAYINTEEFKENYYKSILRQKYSEFIDDCEDVNKWSFDACSFFSHEHQLAKLKTEDYNISIFDELPEEPIFITKVSRGREYKNYEIYRIAGVILDKNDNHHSISLLDIKNHVIECKFDQNSYAYYKSQISEIDGDKKIVMDKPWLARGNAVILTGYRNGADDFIIKTYKSSIFQHKVQIIDRIDNEGNILIRSTRYDNDEKEANNEN